VKVFATGRGEGGGVHQGGVSVGAGRSTGGRELFSIALSTLLSTVAALAHCASAIGPT